MNRTLKRVLGLAGSAVLGLAGAVTFASAAQAHHVEIEGITECTPDGGWTVVWQVTDWNSQGDVVGEIETVTVDGEFNEGTEIVPGAVLPHPSTGDYLEGSQNFGADVTGASITIDAVWDNGNTNTSSAYVPAPEGGCEAEEPRPEGYVDVWTDCFGINVYAWNESEEALAEFTIETSDGFSETVTPAVGDDYYNYFEVTDPDAGLAVTILIDGELYDTFEWDDNPMCHYASVESDCENGLTFTLTVPADGDETTFYFWESLTETEQEVVVAPGETGTVNFPPAAEEFWVYYEIYNDKDFISGETPWYPCDVETPSESPSPKPELPKTGSSLTIMISSAAALIAAAGVIFFLMRRRRAAQDW
ncbi:LPXTG cell wall anchor domain-containing protein [Glycomyces terrestris]|uniref:LPXTG cell wall anchor domain-containing protein n=1 Tax=Glycomyces terrestris TaxID=2493553 RepID=A0A426V551_9ACTN|nr:LPXTG cell wall anchor domain-containing protein [Glycomyces terrestris]RRS02013.1 LPXTG cell wall anchor domain-containing protein [Glycomyces terrestris]